MVNIKLLAKILLVLLLVSSSTAYLDTPPIPSSFYGEAYVFNSLLTPFTIVVAYDHNGNPCGSFDVEYSGKFGVLICKAKNTTADGFGGESDKRVTFRVGGNPASVLLNGTAESLGNVTWEGGTFKNITLIVPPLVCGDGFCDRLENCETCPEDCGECVDTPPSPGPTDPGDIDPSIPDPSDVWFPEPPPPLIPEEECIEDWSCTEWGPCLLGDYQVRTCVDLNNCGTEEYKPEEEQFCVYEERIEINITDEDPVPPREELPVLIDRCEERLNILGIHSLVFFLLVLALLIIPVIRYKLLLKKLDEKLKKKKIEDIFILKKKYLEKRRLIIYLVMTFSLSVVVYLYHYFFFLCRDVYISNLWLLGLFVFLTPFFVHYIILLLKYSDKDKEVQIKLFNDTHYMHIKSLVKILDKQLIESENEISNSIFSLSEKDEFHDLINDIKPLKIIYKDMLKLYEYYKDDKDNFKLEKELAENIKELDSDEVFSKAVLKHPELNKLKNNLNLLYKSYEHKQELYDELNKIESEYYGDVNSKNKDDSDKGESVKGESVKDDLGKDDSGKKEVEEENIDKSKESLEK